MGGLKAEGGKKSGCLNGKDTLINTATEYAGVSSIHGISYIFERSQGIVSRFAWLLIVMSAVTVGVYWSFKVRLCTLTVLSFTFKHYNHTGLSWLARKSGFNLCKNHRQTNIWDRVPSHHNLQPRDRRSSEVEWPFEWKHSSSNFLKHIGLQQFH